MTWANVAKCGWAAHGAWGLYAPVWRMAAPRCTYTLTTCLNDQHTYALVQSLTRVTCERNTCAQTCHHAPLGATDLNLQSLERLAGDFSATTQGKGQKNIRSSNPNGPVANAHHDSTVQRSRSTKTKHVLNNSQPFCFFLRRHWLCGGPYLTK